MPLPKEAAAIVTRAQNLHNAVKPMFRNVKPEEGLELTKMKPENAAAYALWLLGTKIPRLARGERVEEAALKLALAQGIVLGLGFMSRHDVHLATMAPPVPRTARESRGKVRSFCSLTV